MADVSQWIEIASKFGVPVVMLALLGLFLWKAVWPFVVRQIEEAQAARKVELEKFIDTIRARDTLFVESQREQIATMQAMAAKIEGNSHDIKTLTDEVRKGRTR